MGDFNAQVGKRLEGENRILGLHSTGRRSKNGEKLIHLALEHNLTILNSIFKKRQARKWTWISPDGKYKNEIDFILTNKPHYIEDLNVINRLNFNTNHRMVRAHLKTKLPQKSRRLFRNSVSRLSSEQKCEMRGRIEQSLQHFEKETKDLKSQDKYNIFENILRQPNLIQRSNSRKQSFITDFTLSLLEERKKLICNSSEDKRSHRKQISELSKKIRTNMRNDRKMQRMKTIEEHIVKTGGTRKAMKLLDSRKSWMPKLSTQSDQEKSERGDILRIATDFYSNLYKKIEESSDLEIDLSEDIENIPYILPDEIEKAVKSQKRDKAPGPDGISNDLLIGTSDLTIPILTQLFNEILQTEEIPSQWTTSNIILLYKKGDKHDIGNYRPISLMSNIYKIFAKVILDRISRTLDENQPIEQAGFRKGFSVIDHIHTVKQIFEKAKEYNLTIYCTFIDYNKAFDSLNHSIIWKALKSQGLANKYIRLVKNVYNKSTAKIQLEREGPTIQIQRGVRQGDPLSPKLFTAVLEQIFRQLAWDDYGIGIDGTKLSHLRFADDILLFAKSPNELQTMITQLVTESKIAGLEMNTNKTKVMTNNIQEKPAINLGNHELDYVEEYIYLGQVISIKDQMQKEIERRTTHAWNRYWSLREVMKNKALKTSIKGKVFNSCILPVLTYGCQSWATTKAQDHKLQVCQHSMERSMLGVKRKDRVKLSDLRKASNCIDVKTTIKRLKWRWAGHMMRGIEKWNKRATIWLPRDQKRKRGRQYRRWEDEIKQFVGITWTRLTKQRKEWKDLEEAFADGHADKESTN